MEFQIPYTNWMWLPKWKAEDKEEPCLVYFRKVFWSQGKSDRQVWNRNFSRFQI